MLAVRTVSKAFGSHRAVDSVSFTVERGRVLALLGPSGSGKSTLLSLIAGLEAPDAGDIVWDGQSLLHVPTHQRGFGLMFQDYALFPHKDVADNVGFGLKMQGQTRAETAEGVAWALKLVGLKGLETRDVNTLSGGEQQRVALARALAPRPRLLMLDEPLGALDRVLREQLLDQVHGILSGLHQTAIYVTHDQEEAFALSDDTLILRQGRLAQHGTPAEVYARPASRFVAEFLGLRNLLPGRVRWRGGRAAAETALGLVPLEAAGADAAEDQAVTVLIRPEAVSVVDDDEARAASTQAHPLRFAPGRYARHEGHLAKDRDKEREREEIILEGQVVKNSFRGSRNMVTVRVGEAELTVEFPAAQVLPEPRATVRLRLEPGAAQVLTEDG